jgi:hypothetical protein
MSVTANDDAAQITTGELSRAVTLIRGDINQVRKEVAEKPTTRDVEYLKERIDGLQSWQTWAMRVGIPGFVMALYSVINQVTGK